MSIGLDVARRVGFGLRATTAVWALMAVGSRHPLVSILAVRHLADKMAIIHLHTEDMEHRLNYGSSMLDALPSLT
jgi:hypothetical protein